LGEITGHALRIRGGDVRADPGYGRPGRDAGDWGHGADRVSDVLIGLLVFALMFGGALVGMFLGKVLPTQHLSADSRDVIRVTMAMLATLSALVLGLLTGAAINSLAEKDKELQHAGIQFIMLDRMLASYGAGTEEARNLLKQTLARRIGEIWPGEGRTVSLDALGAGSGIEAVRDRLFSLTSETERQGWLRANALEITNAIAQSRWTTVEQIGSRFPWGFFIVVVGWLIILFASFGLFAPRNGSVIAALGIAAFGLAGAIFMILEVDQPYDGMARIPSTSLSIALAQLGRD